MPDRIVISGAGGLAWARVGRSGAPAAVCSAAGGWGGGIVHRWFHGRVLDGHPCDPGLDHDSISNQMLLQRVGGVITILMGLVFMGFIPGLQRQARFTPKSLSTLGGAPLLGAVFGLGWTPCLGPTLTGVIAVASATEGANMVRGVVLVSAYCLGLGIPFVLLALGSARAVHAMGWLRRNTRAIQIFGGVLLVAVGLALVTGLWSELVSWLRDAFVTNTTLPI